MRQVSKKKQKNNPCEVAYSLITWINENNLANLIFLHHVYLSYTFKVIFFQPPPQIT